jgi:hypothetical protein
MTADHAAYEDLASERRGSPGYREGYAEAQRAFLIGQAVRERRLALGLSQVELATRAAMTQPALSRLEAGGVIPPSPCSTGSPRPSTPTSSSNSSRTPPDQPAPLRIRQRKPRSRGGDRVAHPWCTQRQRR